jgi:hypothetical protein
MKKHISIAVILILLSSGCSTLDTFQSKWTTMSTDSEKAESTRSAAKKAPRSAGGYMEAGTKIRSESFNGGKARYIGVKTQHSTGRRFACMGDANVTAVDDVVVVYFSMRPNDGWLDHATSSVIVDDKFKFLGARKGQPFNHAALSSLKKSCLDDGSTIKAQQIASNERNTKKAQAIKDRPKVAKNIKRDFVKLVGKSNIITHPSSLNLLEVEALVRASKIKKGTYIKLECKGQCRINQYQMTQPTSYGFLLAHKSIGAKKWEFGQGLPYLLTSKQDIFKGENIEDKILYIQYTGLGSYMSLGGNKQALKIKEIK